MKTLETGLSAIDLFYGESPVWWVDLESGPVEAVTLFDAATTKQPRDGYLWMMSLDQWDNAEWPAESQGGPPYTPHVSVAREAQDHFNDPWPPNEHGVIYTQIDMPKGPPRWLETPSARGTIPVRIDTNAWKEILRVDGYAAANRLHESLTGGSLESAEESIDRQAKWLLEVLTGGRRTEGDGSMSPNSIYIDAARYFQPRARFVRYGKKEKYGIWAGAGFFKKESIREILSAVIVEHEGSTVWLYDLEAGKPDRVLTLWEMIGDWFVDVDGKRIGARRDTGAFGPLPVYYIDMVREPGTVRARAPEKKLWPMSEAQWESGEWPSVDVGGPPAAKYGMEASEASSTMRLFHGTRHAHVEKLVASKGGEFGPGVYLTADPNMARFFAENARGPDEPTVLEVTADIRNPIRICKTDWIKKTANRTPSTVQRALIKKGYDAIIGVGLTDSEQIIVFDPNAVSIRQMARENPSSDGVTEVLLPKGAPRWLRQPGPEPLFVGVEPPLIEGDFPPNERRHLQLTPEDQRVFWAQVLYPATYNAQSWYDFATRHKISSSPNDIKVLPGGTGVLVETVQALLDSVQVRASDGDAVWWVDLDRGPVRPATLWDLVRFQLRPMQPQLTGSKKKPRELWLLSLGQWDRAEFPPESQGGPPYTPHVSVSREAAAEDGAADAASDAALICMGRDIILELEDCDDVELPVRWGMLHDPSGTYWPKCSLLFCKFSQGKQKDSTDEGVGYFGKRADVRRGKTEMPPHDLHHGWREIGIVKQVFYARAGKHEGRYKHKFNDPRGWMWVVALFKKRVAETPVVLFEYNQNGVVALRLELPDGCAVDDRGIALP